MRQAPNKFSGGSLLALLLLCVAALLSPAAGQTGATGPAAALYTDPERVFDVLSIPGALKSLSSGSTSVAGAADALAQPAAAKALTDGSTATQVSLALPPASQVPKEGKKLLVVTLNKNYPITEISMRLNADNSTGDNLACLSRAYWMDGRMATKFTTLPNRREIAPEKIKNARISWLPAAQLNGTPQNSPSTLTLYLPKGCNSTGDVTAVTELQLFTKPSLSVFGASAGLLDDHFHPCSFSHYCTNVTAIAAEQKREGFVMAFLFGLQHTMAAGANRWIEAVFGRDKGNPKGDFDQTPFHYNDLGALPSSSAKAQPGIKKVNEERSKRGLPVLAGYDGWPMWANSRADWQTISDYYRLVQANAPGVKGHIFPFLSSLRIDKSTETLYDVCTKNNATGLLLNEMLLRSMDTLFPDSVFGYQEYNLNKTVVAEHDVPAPVISQAWQACMAPIFKYMAETKRLFGVHCDIVPWKKDYGIFIIAKSFPETIMVWDHGGFAPEVDKRLSAKDHIALLNQFLATAPKGQRYVDVSWNTGFWLRFLPNLLGEVEIDSANGMKEVKRDWVADCRAYMQFFKQNQDHVVFGSDQVSLDYPDSLTKGFDGNAIYDRPGYFQAAATYGGAVRQQLGTLYNCMKVAGPDHQLSPETVTKMFSSNGAALMAKTKPPKPGKTPSIKYGFEFTGMTAPEAKAFMRFLLTLQWEENKRLAGADAPTLQQFLPKELQA